MNLSNLKSVDDVIENRHLNSSAFKCQERTMYTNREKDGQNYVFSHFLITKSLESNSSLIKTIIVPNKKLNLKKTLMILA